MINRNDWQVFYRQKIKEMGSLIHLPEVLPPRFKETSQIRGEETGVAEPKLEKPNPEELIVQNSISKRSLQKKSSPKNHPQKSSCERTWREGK